VQAKTWGYKGKCKIALFGFVASFLIWGNVISSNKYLCYFLNDIKGIFSDFLSESLPEACFVIYLTYLSIFVLPFPFKSVPGVLKGKQESGLKLKM